MTQRDSKSRRGPSVWLFVSFFLAVLGPTVALLLVGLLGPEPYVLVREELEPYADTARLRQDAEVETKSFPDQAAAREAARRYVAGIAKRQAGKTLQVHRYVREDNGKYELVMPIDDVLLRMAGRDREHVDAVFEDLPFIAENPDKNWVWLLITDYLKEFLIGIFVYAGLLTVVFSRMTSRSARVAPTEGVEPATADQLRERLMALTGLDLPFHIVESGRGRLVAEWRLADEKWGSALRKAGLRVAHSLQLELDERQAVVRSIQTSRRAAWSAGALSFVSRFSWSRQISFYHRASGASYGVVPKAGGWELAENYAYRYQLSEIVQPVVSAIVDAGWEFRPVFTFFRPVGG